VVENLVVTRFGDERLIEWRNTVLRDDAGRVIGTFSSGTAVTERTQAVAAVRTAEERMRFALEASGVGIWDMDYTTGVLQWSELLESQYGLRPGTFAGTYQAFVERIHPDDGGRRSRRTSTSEVRRDFDSARSLGLTAPCGLARGLLRPRRSRRPCGRRHLAGRQRANPQVQVADGKMDG
jgi:PAS domain-containing protein